MSEILGGFSPRQDRQETLIRQLQAGLAGRRVKVGTVTLTWANGAAFSAVATPTHGLGATPFVVLALVNGTGGPDLIIVQAFNIGATTFQIQGKFAAGVAAGVVNVNCGWLVVA